MLSQKIIAIYALTFRIEKSIRIYNTVSQSEHSNWFEFNHNVIELKYTVNTIYTVHEFSFEL